MAKAITETSMRVYEYIKEYILKNMYSPTMREIGKATGLSSTCTVKYNIEKLREAGLITLSDNNNKIALPGYKVVKDE